jgi:cytoskeletal protein CcmA (bactofilin family)
MEKHPLKNILYKTLHDQKGAVMVLAVLFLLVLSMWGAATITLTRNDYLTTSNYIKEVQAYYLAEAGLEEAIAKIFGNPTDIPSSHSGSLTTGSYAVAITESGHNPIIVVLNSVGSVGNINKTLNCELEIFLGPENPVELEDPVQVIDDLEINNDDWDGTDLLVDGNLTLTSSAVITGNVNITGDIYMTGNSTINGAVFTEGSLTMPHGSPKIINNDAYVMGDFYMGGGSFIRGDLYVGGNANITNGIVEGNVYVAGNLHMDGGAAILGYAFVEGDCLLDSSNEIDGDILVGGQLTMDWTPTVYGDAYVIVEPIYRRREHIKGEIYYLASIEALRIAAPWTEKFAGIYDGSGGSSVKIIDLN